MSKVIAKTDGESRYEVLAGSQSISLYPSMVIAEDTAKCHAR